MFKYIFLSLALFDLAGCAPDLEDVVQEWTDKGWKRVRSHGIEKEFNRHGMLKSQMARAIEASWIENGKRKTKLYKQDNFYYLALRFFCKDGDEFVIIMRKIK